MADERSGGDQIRNDRWPVVPDTWAPVPADLWEKAHGATWRALNHERVVDRVSRYYGRDGNFAGATFLTVGPVDPYSFTEGDLLALTLLSVSVGPAAVRRLTEPSPAREELIRLFSEEHLALDSDLAMADIGTLQAMRAAHVRVKQAISATDLSSANPWVTASKLCARKRPDLFPVRDGVVCDALGLSGKHHNYEVDWQVFRQLISDHAIRQRLMEIVDVARQRPGVDVGTGLNLLRHLDVILWMTYRRGAESMKAPESALD